jgi:hypothetical protein
MLKRYKSIFEAQDVSSKSTAIKRTKLALPIKDWLKNNYFEGFKTILDFGAGRGDNVVFLQESLGSDVLVTGYEPHPHSINPLIVSKYEDLEPSYDCIYSTFVLNVVPKEIQDEIVSQIKKKSSNILIATRDDIIPEMKKMKRFIGKSEEELLSIALEGFQTGKDSMQRLVTEIPGFKELNRVNGKYRVFVKS